MSVDLAPDLIIESHLNSEEVSTTPLRDLIPSIVLREQQPIEGRRDVPATRSATATPVR